MLEQKDIANFWSKTRKGDAEECWPWLACTVRSGHGQIWVKGKHVAAHRFSYMLHCGEIPSGLLICHRCNVPNCVNPAHLYVGTKKDNARDAIAAGTFRYNHAKRGAENHGARFKDDDVVEIRRLVSEGESRRALARLYDVSTGTVCAIVNRKTWQHV